MKQVSKKEQLIKSIRERIPTETKSEKQVLKEWGVKSVEWLKNLSQIDLEKIEKKLSVVDNDTAEHINSYGPGMWNWKGYKPNSSDFWDDFDNKVDEYFAACQSDDYYFKQLDENYKKIFRFSEFYAEFKKSDLGKMKQEYEAFKKNYNFPLGDNYPIIESLCKRILGVEVIPTIDAKDILNWVSQFITNKEKYFKQQVGKTNITSKTISDNEKKIIMKYVVARTK